jgi:hypothetical protein
MDRLARNAMLAKQANMSYGKWKAMQPIVPIEKKNLPDGRKECPVCGRHFKPQKKQQKYCEPGCRNSAYKPKGREIKIRYMKEYRKRRKEKDGGRCEEQE